MILDTTSKTIEVILPGAITTNQLEITADWVDTQNGSTFAPGGTSLVTNGGTAVTAVAAPAASTQRQVKALTIYNADTVNQTVTVRMFDGTNRRRHVAAALLPGGSLVFTPEGGWSVLTATPGQIIGTATNDNAASGNIGEFVSVSLPLGSAVGLSNGVGLSIMNVTLGAGDWDVSGVVWFNGAAGTTITELAGGINSATNTLPTRADINTSRVSQVYASFTPFGTDNPGLALNVARISLAASTTYFLVALAQFGTSTCSAYGNIHARRMR